MFDSDQPARPTFELLRALRRSEWQAGRASLASRFSHDLGTPLNVILGRVSLLLASEDLPESSARHARLIAEAARAIADGLQGTLDDERLTTSPSSVNVGTMLDGVVALLAPLASANDVELVYEPELGDARESMMDLPATVNILTSLLGRSITSGCTSLRVESAFETVERPDDLRCAPGRYLRVTLRTSGAEGESAAEDPRRAHTDKHLLRALGGFLRSDTDNGKTTRQVLLPMRKP